MTWDIDAFERDLQSATKRFDTAAKVRLCADLIAHLGSTDDVIEVGPAKRILYLLRRKRHFDLMQQVADALLRSGQTALQIRRQYAQALIDQGSLTAAASVLEALIGDSAHDLTENAEARGLVGRVWKQRFVNAANPGIERNREALRAAIRSYSEVFATDASQHWHGVNAAALLLRARRDGIPVEGFPPAEALASRILADLEDLDLQGKVTPWGLGTAAEAALALGRTEDAAAWLARYAMTPEADAFELASTLRQLLEVWQLTDAEEPGASLLPLLRSQLLLREGTAFSLDGAAVRGAIGDAERALSPQLERILGEAGMQSLRWYRVALDRALAVASIETETEAVGTGFLLEGQAFDGSLDGELLLLTNAHVVSAGPAITKALRPGEAVVRFEALGGATSRVRELLWSSPPDDLDASVLRLATPPKIRLTFPLAPALPIADGAERVYIIGHPGGRELSISFQDNLLLDWEDPRIHYRAPTEPGNSGSPVFNGQWGLIGLHHAGDRQMRRLHGQPGFHAANEGIWIQTILRRFRAEWKS